MRSRTFFFWSLNANVGVKYSKIFNKIVISGEHYRKILIFFWAIYPTNEQGYDQFDHI